MGRKSKSKNGSSQETEFDNPLTPAAKDAAVERGGAIFESTSTDNATETATFDKEDQALGGEEVSGAEWGTLKIGQAMAKGDVDVVILNWCRNACASIWLDSVVLAAIILNTILLAIESPANTLSEETLDMIVIIDMVLTIGFTVEMFIRIIAMGFWDRKGEGTAPNTVYRPCYLNDDWNKLDFFVVISSWVNVVVEYVGTINVDLSTLRALRILRVLKAFKKIEGIRQILATIAQAIPYSINVIAFLAFLFVICGIIGVQMFRGAGKKRCVYGGFDLTAHLDPDKFPLVTLNSGNVSTVLGNSHPWPQPPPVLEPTYEYPIGIGVWISYCDVDSDCPLFDVPDQWNRTQTCQPSLNPGKGYQHFDTIIDAWIALFINMANLYWWETAHRISDANVGMGSVIAWGFGAFNVFFLSYVTVNMFVAVITTVFMDVRSEGNAEGGFGAGTDETFEEKFKRQARELQEASDRWKKPPYFVPLFGGEGPFIESAKEDPAERKGLIWALWFDRGILGFIFINTFALAAEHHDRSSCDDPTTLEIEMQSNELCMDQDFVEANMYANYVFNFVFTVECIMKVGGMGFVEYIKPAFNKLDFFIVVTSGLDMIGEAMATDDEGSGVGIFKLFRVFRLFRVLRVARILYKNKNLKRVLTTVFGSGDAIANLVLFIFFAVLLFAIMGMHLTGGRYHPEHKPEMGYGDNSGTLWGRLIGSGQYDVRFLGNETRHGYNVQDFIRKGLIPRRNFEDFPRAFLLAFQVMTGDDWVNQMHDVMEVKGGIVPPLLFFANFSFCNFILLNLFIAVILENFEIAEAEKAALQKMKYEQDKVAEVEAARKPKIKFVHRLVWLVGGEGKKSGSLCGMSEDVGLDTEGAYSELDADGDPVEFGMIMPGSKWYNDDKALFFMDRDHSARKVTKALAENQIFDFVVLCAILLGTLLLALEGPPGSIDEDTQFIFDRINDLLFGIFIVEFVAKVCAYGFMFTPQSYLMNAWNKLDFIVILGSVANYMGGNVGFIRLLRCLRPLRIINRNEGMRVIISAVVNSLAVNLGVLALSGLGLLIFAILGVSLFAGQFWSCNCSFTYPLGVTPTAAVFHYNGGWTMHSANISHPGPPQEVLTEQHCVGVNGTGGLFGVDGAFPDSVVQCYWDNRPYNFDTTPNAMMALFTASTLAGWTDIMEVGLDGTGIGMQPVPFSGVWGAKVVYFLVYVMVMSFFVTNLFVGVLIDFIGSSDGTALLTVKQQEAKDLSKFQKLHRPTLRDSAPDNCFRSWFWHLVESRFWDQLSNGFIIFNVIVMMCEYEPELGEEDAWQRWMNALELLNMVCLWFFTIEMVFKLIAYFPIKYWADPWSKFDATVITLSWAAIIFDLGSVQAIRAMRALRIVLVLKNAKGIRSLFQTLIMSIAPATNITVLLLLLYAIYAIAGMMLFGTMPVQDVECTSRPTPLQPDYCSPQYGIAEEDIASWFSGIAKGKAGQYLMGANRQYTHHSSFRNFGSAMTLLFQCAAGQDWKFVMCKYHQQVSVLIHVAYP
jgi:hypothetical protein